MTTTSPSRAPRTGISRRVEVGEGAVLVGQLAEEELLEHLEEQRGGDEQADERDAGGHGVDAKVPMKIWISATKPASPGRPRLAKAARVVAAVSVRAGPASPP